MNGFRQVDREVFERLLTKWQDQLPDCIRSAESARDFVLTKVDGTVAAIARNVGRWNEKFYVPETTS